MNNEKLIDVHKFIMELWRLIKETYPTSNEVSLTDDMLERVSVGGKEIYESHKEYNELLTRKLLVAYSDVIDALAKEK